MQEKADAGGLPQLDETQIREWTREQKDRWWLENVFRGNMPQLTLRAAVTGFLLGGILSATNLYVGAKTGWTLGVGLTSVILAFAMFKMLAQFGARDMTILENNCTQSIATAAGYMTGPLISGMTAWMWVENRTMNWAHMLLFNVVLSILGVLVAFPMKRRFINDEQQPFPEGRACGVVLNTLYNSSAAIGLFKAKALAIAAAIAGLITFLSGAAYLKAIHALILSLQTGVKFGQVLKEYKDKIAATWTLPHDSAGIYAWLGKFGMEPQIGGVKLMQLGINPSLDLAMIGAGGLMGIKAATSMLIGVILNFMIIAPIMINFGEIQPRSGSLEAGNAMFGRVHIVNNWALWWGIVMMVVASIVSLFAKPQVFVEAFKALTTRKSASHDVLGHIELPLWISWVGVPLIGAVAAWMAHEWFGVHWMFSLSAIFLIIFLTLIAASSTAMTGITPTGSLSKIPQFLFGSLDPKHPPTNLMTGVMCVEVASNASNLLMDIKPGYMLGAKPRQQAIGHCIGIIAGAIASTPLFFALFLSNVDKEITNSQSPAVVATQLMENASQPASAPKKTIQEIMVPEGGQFAFPSAMQWKGVSDLVTSIFGGPNAKTLLTTSIIWSMGIAGVVSFVFEVLRIITRNKFPLSPLAIGLGVVVPPDSTIAMFAGAFFFWWAGWFYGKRPESTGHKLWVDTQEPICAGIIAGAALIGIGETLTRVFILGG